MNPPVPSPDLDAVHASLRSCRGPGAELVVQPFALPTPWDEATPGRRLTAVFARAAGHVRAFVTDAPVTDVDASGFDATAAHLGAAVIDLDAPLRLTPAVVPKPWGRELWLTGVERRGVSGVTDSRHTTPLPWALALAPSHLQGRAPLILLKILDPSPRPVQGDLYFEVHETKREVYVVTRLDPSAWPEGHGTMRFGMNADLRARYADDARFRADYLVAVQRYAAARRALEDGAPHADAATEARLRAEMEAFTGRRELKPGDVVHVPTWLPHGLRHGVRVVELQDPVYERRILSFAQSTPTQDRWDTADVIDRLRLDVPPPPSPAVLATSADACVERIARFDTFTALRVSLARGGRHRLEGARTGRSADHGDRYRLCLALEGSVQVNGLELAPEEACLVPAAAHHLDLVNPSEQTVRCLVAEPTP